MIIDNFNPLVHTIGGGFFAGALTGYALKKVLKILSIFIGLFLAGLAYLQYQGVTKINCDKLEFVYHDAISTLADAITQISNSVIGYDYAVPTTTAIATKFGTPLTGSMMTGFAIGFMKR